MENKDTESKYDLEQESITTPAEDDKINPVNNERKYDTDKDSKSPNLVVPSVVLSKLISTLEDISKLTKINYEKHNDIADTISLGVNMDSTEFTNSEDMLYSPLNKDGVTNKLNFVNKDLGIRPLPINSSGKSLNGDAAIARISSALGIGEVTQIPLWHSGFWVTLKPIKEIDLINLEVELTNNQIMLGRDTGSLIYSNYQVVFNRIITQFIIDNIESTTLDSKSGISDIRDYIMIQDLNILVNGLLYSMHPNGYPLVRTCSNSAIIIDNKPKCNYVVSGDIDFRKMLYVNRPALSKEHIKQMSKRNPNSVSIKDVEEYQQTLYGDFSKSGDVDTDIIYDDSISNIVSYTTSTGTNFKFYLKSPTLSTYIDSGERWVNDIVSKSEAVFTDATTTNEKNRIINDTTAAVVSGQYNSYIDKIVINDTDIITDVNEPLGMLGSDPELLVFIIESVKNFINDTTIAAVGIPNYICPACKESQVDETDKPFKDIIPVNVIESFFALCVLKVQSIRDRNM